MDPIIIVDNLGTIHVVWSDNTDGPWGTDSEIMYLKLFEDDNAPILTHPDDIIYEEGMTGNFINWTAIDLNPNTYTIT